MIKKLPILITAAGVMLSMFAGGPAQADEATDTPADNWSCDMTATGVYAPCVQDTQTTGDENWYRGYKLTFNWETPLDQAGNPYERCVLTYYKPAYGDFPSLPGLEQIDVPAAWGTYTMPLGQQNWLTGDITPGNASLTEEYYCYTPGVGASMRVTSDKALIPDMPPTTPTDVSAEVTDAGLDVTTGGSVAVGVAALEGYTINVTDAATDQVVGDTTAEVATSSAVVGASYHAASARVMRAAEATAPANAVSRVFKNLKPGTYDIAVASYNRIGQSATTVKTVTVRAAAPAPVATKAPVATHAPAVKKAVLNKVRVVKTKITGKNVKVTWQAPKATKVTGYRVELVKAGKVIKRTSIAKAKHAYTFHQVKRGTYTVRVIDIAAGNRSATVTKTVHVKAVHAHRG